MKLSIVSPVYKASGIIPELVSRISHVCESEKYNYEIILVDDGSLDNSWKIIESLSLQYPKLRGFKLSKNYGQHYAISAGIHKAQGDYVVIMDCDLQDDPAYIPQLIDKSLEGFNVVCTIKQVKKYGFLRRLTSDLYFFIINRLSDIKLEKNLGTMTLIDRKVADAFSEIKDYHRHSSMVFAWLGFNRGYIETIQQPRFSGKSSYNFRKLLSHAINGVISQSDRLLKVSITIGLMMFGLSILGGLYIVVKSFTTEFEAGWPSLSVLILFTSGIILLMIGILGLYLGKVFEQVKNRPLYIISEQTDPLI
jgi:dolichol-phosphate mannosyltransferase